MNLPRRLADGTLGDWINERLLDHSAPGARVGSVVPTCFARVVRVPHPAADGRSWAEVARASDKLMLNRPGVSGCDRGRSRRFENVAYISIYDALHDMNRRQYLVTTKAPSGNHTMFWYVRP